MGRLALRIESFNKASRRLSYALKKLKDWSKDHRSEEEEENMLMERIINQLNNPAH